MSKHQVGLTEAHDLSQANKNPSSWFGKMKLGKEVYSLPETNEEVGQSICL